MKFIPGHATGALHQSALHRGVPRRRHGSAPGAEAALPLAPLGISVGFPWENHEKTMDNGDLNGNIMGFG